MFGSNLCTGGDIGIPTGCMAMPGCAGLLRGPGSVRAGPCHSSRRICNKVRSDDGDEDGNGPAGGKADYERSGVPACGRPAAGAPVPHATVTLVVVPSSAAQLICCGDTATVRVEPAPFAACSRRTMSR